MSGDLPKFRANPRGLPAPMREGMKLAIFGVMAFGQFMALLDTQIWPPRSTPSRAGCPPAPTKSLGCRPPI